MIFFSPANLFNSVIVTTLAISKVDATFALANIGTVNGYYSHVAACGSSRLVCDCWTSASPSYVNNLSACSISPGVCDCGQLAVVWQGTSDEWYVYSDGNNVVATCSSWYAPSVECDNHIEVAPLLYCVSSEIQC